jgi:salicylate hydroxylase
MANIYHGPYLHVHRAIFHKILCDEAERLGVKIKLGSTVTGIDLEKSTLKIQGKPDLCAEFILGADGLKSACREALLGHPDPPRETGDMAYRITLPTGTMRKYKELNDFALKPNFNYWAGPGGHAVSYLVREGALFNLVVTAVDTLPSGIYRANGDLKEMQERFKDWSPTFRLLLSLVKETVVWKLLYTKEMKNWKHLSGRFALLGDACHASLPYL